jgi:preprotein translocase subunit SecF
MRFFPETNFDFVGVRKYFITISLIVICAGLISIWTKGGLPMSVEFTGGTVIHVKFQEAQDFNELRHLLAGAGLTNSVVQQSGENTVLIKVSSFESEPEVKLREAFKDKTYEVLSVEGIGPQVSKDLQKKALLAILLANVGILVYVGYRFKPIWGLAGIIALVHDVIITLGFCSFFNKEMSLTVIAAFLALIGYSINDTIVVFDRIRENLKLKKGLNFSEIINLSINQNLARTTLTVLTVFLVALSIFFFGGSVIHDFAFVLVIGLITGTYSSIFIASPIILFWQKD